MIRQRLVAGFVTATALVTLAACGSDSKSSSTTKPTSTKAPAATTGASAAGSPGTSGGGIGAGAVSTSPTGATDATSGAGTASGDTTPDVPNINDTIDVSVPAGLSGDCKALYTNLVNSAGGADGTAKLDDLYKALEKAVPADLKDDVEVLRTTFENYQNAITKAGGGAEAAADPDVQKAEAALGDEKLQTATQNITNWFDKTCPELADTADSTPAT
jgi:hypothetical protein